MQRRVIGLVMAHRSPYTGLRYVDDPAIALLTIVDQASPWYFWAVDYLNDRAGIISPEHSKRLDTLFTEFLGRRYGTTANLRAAYREGIASDGPNVVRNPGFEAFNDNWELTVGEGAQASMVIVQGNEVAPSGGANSLRVVVRAANGVEGRIYLQQTAIPVRRDGIYRVRFRAKTDTVDGRTLRLTMFRGTPPYTTLGLDTTVALTTAWQTYETTFRSFDTDSLGSIFRFYIGRSAGDVYLDGVELVESGRDGLFAGESLELRNVSRAKLSVAWRLARRRAVDLSSFYDSLGRAYYHDMIAYVRSIGARVPVAGTNATSSSVDTRSQAEFDFTSETSVWDYNGARPGLTYSDSTWVIRQYSVLNYRDQKIPEFSRAAISGKPFVAEMYGHVYPNRHRSEMMLYLPAYASLHDWDGAYFYNYTGTAAELATRRRAIKDDFYQIADDPSITALLPQYSAVMRHRWIAPSERAIEIQLDSADLADLPLNYYFTHNNTYNTDGGLNNVMNMVHAVRMKTFDAPRHMTSGDYYFTVPEDDNIGSDTREIVRDITKGTMTVNTPFAQGGSGQLGSVSTLATDNLAVGWINGAAHATYLWTSLDSNALDSARRSLLTISTRSLNEGAAWQYGDSSLGKAWGAGPTQLESISLGLNFSTSADSLFLYPLDSAGHETGRVIAATRSGGSWRAIIDLSVERTPWFGVRQAYAGETTSGVETPREAARVDVGDVWPMPVTGRSSLRVHAVGPSAISLRVYDAIGREALPAQMRHGADETFSIDGVSLSPGAYVASITVDGVRTVRRFVVTDRR
jgi:hypothetical protein